MTSHPIDNKTKKRIVFLLPLTLMVITSLAFISSLSHDFTNWDDPIYVIDNQAIRDLSWGGIKQIFSRFMCSNYIPLTFLSYAVEYHFFGLNPQAFHATNLVLHLINTLLVFWFIMRISRNTLVSFLTALLFGIHPLHVESVAWISERKDVLYSTFFLASLIGYSHFQKTKSLYVYSLTLLLFISSLLAKSMAMTLPIILLLMDYFSENRITIKKIPDKIPFLVLAIVFAFVNMAAQSSFGSIRTGVSFSLIDNIRNACYGLVLYLKNLVCPTNLSSFYPYFTVFGGPSPTLLYRVSPFLVVVLGFLAFIIGRKNKSVVFGILFFFITIFPVLQIIPVGGAIAADRYMYVPSIGLLFLFSELIKWLYIKPQKNSPVLKYIVVFGILIYGGFLWGLTRNRTKVWKDSITLWSDVIQKYPTAAVAYHSRARAYFDIGKLDEVLHDTSEAIKHNPKYVAAYDLHGHALLNKNMPERAIQHFTRAISIDSKYALAFNHRGVAFEMLEMYDQALADYNRAIHLNPAYEEPFNNRGNTYFLLGKVEQAISDYSQAIHLNPNYARAYHNRGIVYSHIGQYDRAIDDFSAALKINPSYQKALYNRALAYIEKGDKDSARQDAQSLQRMGVTLDNTFLDMLR